MRVSTNLISNQIVENLNIDLARLHESTQQTTTGLRINVPSDDPLGSQRVVNLNEAMAGIKQYQRNANYVTNWTTASESALTGAADAMKSANSLAIRGANDVTLGQTELNALADDVNGILESIVNSANTVSEGKQLFGGFQTLTPPFQVTRVAGEITAVTYMGDSGVDQVAVDTSLTVNKNVPGNQVFQVAAGTDVFATLINLRDALRAGNNAAVSTGISETSNAHQQIMDQVALLGNKTNRMEAAATNLVDKHLALTKLESQLADVDMPAAIVQLQTAQNVYTAALQSSAKILQQPSLMNFLSTS